MVAFKTALLLLLSVWFLVSCAADEQTRSEVNCEALPVGENLASEFKLKASEKGVRMIYLNLEIGNDSYNPLELQDEIFPDRWVWARSNSEPMLSLPYDYDILSLGLLNYQVRSMTVPLQDQPSGCLAGLNSTSQNMAVGRALLDNVTMDSSDSSGELSPKSGVVCVAMIEEDVQTKSSSIKYHCCSPNGPLIHCDLYVEGSNRLRTFLNVVLICLWIVVHPYYPALLLMLPDYIFNLHYECKKESEQMTNSRQADQVDQADQVNQANPEAGQGDITVYHPRNGLEDAEKEEVELPVDDTSPVTCSTLLFGCVQRLPNLLLSFNLKLVVLMCCICPFAFYVQLGLYLTLKQKWIHECRIKISPGKLSSEVGFSFKFTDIDIKSPITVFFITSGTLVWLMVTFFLRPRDFFLPKGITMKRCVICLYIIPFARACTPKKQTDQSTETGSRATGNQTDQSTESGRRTPENQTDQSTRETGRRTTGNQTDQSMDSDRRTTENLQTDQSTETGRRTTGNQTDQSTDTDRRTTENQTDPSEETHLLGSDSFQYYSTENQTVQSTDTDRSFYDSRQYYSTETHLTDSLTNSITQLAERLFVLVDLLQNLRMNTLNTDRLESVTIGDETIQHLKLLQEAVYLSLSSFVNQLRELTSFCSCSLIKRVNLWKLDESRLGHARFLSCLLLSILFTLIIGLVSGAICLFCFFVKLFVCFTFCSPIVTFLMWVLMKVIFVMASETHRAMASILGISCLLGVFQFSYQQVTTICDFIFGILVFSIMGLVLNIETVTSYLVIFLVVTTNIYFCYSNLQSRYKEVKGFISEYWQQELQTTDSDQSTIPTKLFWFVCDRAFPVKTEICLMFRNMAVILTFLFLAISSIIFFGYRYDISTLVSTFAVFITGAIPSLFFKGLTGGKNFTGWEKIKLKRQIEAAVKEYPRDTSLYQFYDRESVESDRVGINRESEEDIVSTRSRSGHSLVV